MRVPVSHGRRRCGDRSNARRAASPLQGALHGQMEHVALCMTAAQPVGRTGQARQQRCCTGSIAKTERDERSAGGQAQLPGGQAVAGRLQGTPGERALKTCGIAPIARADEGQHGVDVVEAAEAVLHMRRPGRGKCGPALAGVAATQVDAPQQCRGVDQIGHLSRVPSADSPVIQVQCPIDPALRKMEQRQVPTTVRGNDGVHVPPRCVLAHPAHPGTRALGHLEDVRHDVMRASIQRVQGQRRASGMFSSVVLAALLQAERVHGKHSSAAWHYRRPCR